jgi:predicted aspartyl protease
MGEVYATITVYGRNGQSKELHALVDTGATFSKIPKQIAEQLGLELECEVEVELGDHRTVRRLLYSTKVEILGVRRTVPLAASIENERPLIGYTTLEILEFKPNPQTGTLERARPIEYR